MLFYSSVLRYWSFLLSGDVMKSYESNRIDGRRIRVDWKDSFIVFADSHVMMPVVLLQGNLEMYDVLI